MLWEQEAAGSNLAIPANTQIAGSLGTAKVALKIA